VSGLEDAGACGPVLGDDPEAQRTTIASPKE
jgi:hypothetical protein